MTALERWPGTWLLQHKGCAHVAIILQQGIRSLDFLEFGSSGLEATDPFFHLPFEAKLGPEIVGLLMGPEFWPLPAVARPVVGRPPRSCGGVASKLLSNLLLGKSSACAVSFP